MLPTLTEVKAHLRVEENETAENAPLQSLIDAAADYVARYIGRPVPWNDDAGDTVPLPASVKAAMMLIIGDLYAHREGQFVGVSVESNPAVVNMLHFYRVGLGI